MTDETLPTAEASPARPTPRPAHRRGAWDPAAFQASWLAWARDLSQANALPLSGNVAQWMRTFGQVGLFNVNIAGSGNPELEGEITSRYSYGRQLGRILAVLAPLVEERKALMDPPALREFDDMMRDIARLKGASVDDVFSQVQAWQAASPTFHEDLDELLHRLTRLQAATR